MDIFYKIYAIGPSGYELVNKTYDLESVQEIIDELDTNRYNCYLVVKHTISLNMDEPIATGYLDYNVKKR